jgi:hypothetical protein
LWAQRIPGLTKKEFVRSVRLGPTTVSVRSHTVSSITLNVGITFQMKLWPALSPVTEASSPSSFRAVRVYVAPRFVWATSPFESTVLAATFG